MASVDLETFFVDTIEEVLEYIPESDHLELMGLVFQKLHDSDYDLSVLYDHNEIFDEALNMIYGSAIEEDEDFG